ncbi:MAG: S8 family serine peptidase [Flavobacteriaceae bacterium]|nr:S8 family serine peptidase [Flavobacteriaceae bacterium]
MKFFTKSILCLLAVVFSLNTFAQTPAEREQIKSNYDLNYLSQLRVQVASDYENQRQRALEQATVNGWLDTYEFEDGGVGFLIDVIDGQPIYYETTNRNAAITARTDRVHTGGTSGLDLNGENMLVGVWDGGLVREAHQLLEGRAVHIDTETQLSSHATHVTGTIIGSEAFQSGNAMGMAPQAESINYSFRVGSDAGEVLAAITDVGLLVSNHSYGVPPDGGSGPALPVWYLGKYTGSSRLWDQIQFGAPYYLPVWAAGNARNTAHNNQGDGGFDILTNQAVSKNNLVVAATFQVLNYVNAGSVSMSSFSSWGPPDDGRVKPDISAKGVNTFSSTATSNASYSNFSGTSMASPSVAGSILLLQQHYNNLNAEFMRSSTLRGLVLHTADEAGSSPGPDYRFGWGLINTERAAEIISNDGTTSHILELTIQDGQNIEITGNAVPGERLVASITWLDKQGNIVPGQVEDDDTPILINDLDLRVFDENQDVSLPWVLDHFNFTAPATNGDNIRDNIEKVEIDNPAGDYLIRVSHKGTLEEGEQAVSVILSGFEVTEVTLGTPSNDFVQASIFPNPANNELNVQALTQISELEIINLLGQSMGTYIVNANSTMLDISNLKTGTYFLRVTIDNASKVYKFIKR